MIESDVTILGGGLAGLTLALQLRQTLPDASIQLLEKNVHPVPEAAFKVGESTVEVAANYFTEVLGLKDHILDQQLPKLGLRFFFPSEDNRAIEQRLELGSRRYAPTPSYQLDRGRFENYLRERCCSLDINFLDGAHVDSFQIGRFGQRHQVTYRRDGESKTVRTRWLCDASGRRAILKRSLGLQQESPHKANAVWFRVKARIKIDDWSDNPEWQRGHAGQFARWYSTNHLMGTGYWVWLIPLASGSTSLGIVADPTIHPLNTFNSLSKARDWLWQHEPQCAARLEASGGEIQDFRAIKNYAHECKQVFSGKRWGLVGEAGFFLDPFYSPGSDFIAFANTFLTDLIRRDLTGKTFRPLAFLYDRIFKKFYFGTAVTYQGQYQLFGNHQIMPIKVLWDYLIYWSLSGFIFMHGRMCQQSMYVRHLHKLSRLGELNHFMQGFFRDWHQQTSPRIIVGEIDISSLSLLRNQNALLSQKLNDREFAKAFSNNVAQLETFFWEIIDHSGLEVAVPFKRHQHGSAEPQAFRSVFETLAGHSSIEASSFVEQALADEHVA